MCVGEFNFFVLSFITKRGSFGLLPFIWCQRRLQERVFVVVYGLVQCELDCEESRECFIAPLRTCESKGVKSNLFLMWKGGDSIWASLSPQS